MKRYIKYIFLSLLTCFLASSCIEEIAAPQPETGSELATLVPRVKSFTNQYVTKATDPYTQNEKKIEKLTVLIFSGATDEQENHRLIYTQQTNGSSLTLNKSELNTIASTEELTSATVVMFANVSLSDIMKKNSDGTYTAIGNSLTLEELNDCSIHMGDSPVVLSSELESFGGFPMKGVATANLTIGSTTPIVVNLQILYAKVIFEISVAAGTENQALTQPSFTLQKFFVHNVAKRTSVELADGDATASTDHVTTGKEGTGSNNTFTFYIPESRYNPKANENGKIDLDGIYPTGWTTSVAAEDVKGYTDAMAAQLNGVKYFYDDLVQQYKPKLAEGTAGTPSNTEEGLATYVIVKGTYVDYRNTTWDVNYKIYLGKDNAQNFHVDRNSEYTNILTIKGIRNNDTYTDAGSVWIDHRVNVSTDDPSKHITITRETLIDSHIEVRPLRVDLSNTDFAGVEVILPDVNWIAAERFTGQNCLDGSVYCYDSNSKSIGKRKYFTTTLISDLKKTEGNSLILLDKHCAWIYFDENTSTADRNATITIRFLNTEGVAQTSESFNITQRGILRVGDSSSGFYLIESYEEYLHTYDSADKYNLSTSPIDYTQQGLAWGFSDKPISKDTLVSAVSLPDWAVSILNLDVTNTISQRYDYWHSSDGTYSAYTKKSGSWSKCSEFGNGKIFTDRASANMGITIKDMSTMPNSAYQYCLSKNKFKEDADGKHTLDIHWYLPDAYELQSILNYVKTNNTSADLNTNSNYWSSQPSFTSVMPKELDGIDLISENSTSARAVSVNGISDISRSQKNRIRCLYSSEAIQADMSGRIPDGIGGNNTIYMRAWVDSKKTSAGYFQYMLPESIDEPIDEGDYEYPDTDYPDRDNSYNTSNPEFKYVELVDDNQSPFGGFVKDPSRESNWDPYRDNYYYTLATYPGLSQYELQRYNNRTNAYKQVTSNLKSATKTTKYISTVTLARDDLSSAKNLNPLGHTYGDNKLRIEFGQPENTKPPTFSYKEESTTTTTETKYWNTPTYTLESRPKKGSITLSGSQVSKTKTGSSGRNTTADDAKADAYQNAYEEAESEAKEKFYSAFAEKNANDPGWSISGDVTCSVVSATYTDPWGSKYTGWATSCTMKMVASATITRDNIPLYPLTTAGYWSEPDEDTNIENEVIKTDEFRMYSGNSVTISLSNEKISSKSDIRYCDAYEITKIRIYFADGNYIDDETDYGIITRNITTYARFVDSVLIPENGTIASAGSGLWQSGAADSIELPGMTYSDNAKSGEVWQQWTGLSSSVTLVLSDYIYNRIAVTDTDGTYTYKRAETDMSKSFVISKIEVKCSPKPNVAIPIN